ncbi:hypothetical protein GCM10011584_35150 [Nocardioides phosphati]|uniref:DUF4282 domain-containing protein n=1 Tax=Nocardioides phosphati TaxID=1867775 RepID=A0ABQ2NG75_9ACTN|nr:hypothetical protein [Nocardioides phosphati]GGO94341.1 hypothetical protein GCM10011584_35150 [Nocardioides phosphati]
MNDSVASTNLLHDAGTVLSGVADAELDPGVARRMLTAIYRLAVPLVVVPPVAAVIAFAYFVGTDWWLVPVIAGAFALGVVLLVVLRLVLGFGLSLLGFLDKLTQLPGAVLSLNEEVAQLRGGVADLRADVAPLSGVVGTLTGHVDSLQNSLDGVQFWRAPSRLWKAAAADRSTTSED